MSSHHDHYIHDLSLNIILDILKDGEWKTANQAITHQNGSSVPNKNWQLIDENISGINAFAGIDFGSGVKRMLDVGGGRHDNNKTYLKHDKQIELLVWDPFNRTQDHNDKIKADVLTNKVDAATSMSVLNVIAEPAVRLAHIVTLKAALRATGKAYFKIWPGDWPFHGSYFPVKTESAYQANAYANRFIREIEIVFGSNHVRAHESIPNLIVATKITNTPTSTEEVEHILRLSKEDVKNSGKIDRKPINKPMY